MTKIGRRSFVRGLASTSLLPFARLSSRPSINLRSARTNRLLDDPLRARLRGEAFAWDRTRTTEQNAEAMRSLLWIINAGYDMENNGTPPAEALKRIEWASRRDWPFDSTTFDVAVEFFERRDGIADMLTSDERHTQFIAALGFTAFGASLPAFASRGGQMVLGALGAGSVYTPPILEGLLPPVPDNTAKAVRFLTADALCTFFERITEPGTSARDFLDRCVDERLIGFDHKEPLESAISRTPQSIQNVARAASKGESTQGIEKVIRGELLSANAAVEKRIDQLSSEMKDQRKSALLALAEQRRLENLHRTAEEVEGAASLAALLIGEVGGNRATGRRILVTGSAVATLVKTVGSGPLTFAALGGLADAARRLVSVFSTPSDPLFESVRQLHGKVDLILRQLNVISVQQALILDLLQQVFQQVSQQQQAISQIDKQLSVLAAGAAEQAFDAGRKTFTNAQAQFETSVPKPTRSADLGRFDQSYHSSLTDCANHGTTEAAKYALASNRTVPMGLEEWPVQVEAVKLVSRLIGVLDSVAEVVGADRVRLVSEARTIAVNPEEWCQAVQVYLFARLQAPNVVHQAEQTQLQRLWLHGQHVRQSIIRFTSPGTIRSLARQLLAAYGTTPSDQVFTATALDKSPTIAGRIYRAVREYDRKMIRRQPDVRFSIEGTYAIGRPASASSFSFGLTFFPDFFEELLGRKLVTLVSPGVPQTYNVRIAAGPRSGELLVDEPFRSEGARKYFPASPGAGEYNPIPLQARSREFYLDLVAKPANLDGIMAAIQSDLALGGFGDKDRFNAIGALTRCVATLVGMRSASTPSGLGESVLNAEGIFSVRDLQGSLNEWLRQPESLSEAGDWPLEVAQAGSLMIREPLEFLQSRASLLDPNVSIPRLDQTFLMLEGYMASRSVPIPIEQIVVPSPI